MLLLLSPAWIEDDQMIENVFLINLFKSLPYIYQYILNILLLNYFGEGITDSFWWWALNLGLG